MSLHAGWDYGFRSTEKPYRTDVTMIDIEWQRPDIRRHVAAVAKHRPWIAVCPDVTAADQWDDRINLAYELHRMGAQNVMMVPKVTPWRLPDEPWIVLGYPVGVGETSVCPFATMASGWPIHLLGGTITGQLRAMMHFGAGRVISGDQSAHTKAARFGNRYHVGGRRIQSAVMPPGMTGRERLHRDIRDSFVGIRECWDRQAHDVAPRFISMLSVIA